MKLLTYSRPGIVLLCLVAIFSGVALYANDRLAISSEEEIKTDALVANCDNRERQ